MDNGQLSEDNLISSRAVTQHPYGSRHGYFMPIYQSVRLRKTNIVALFIAFSCVSSGISLAVV